MKKVFAVMAIAAALVACNSGSENKEGADTTTVTNTAVDSTATAPAVDTAANMAPATMDTAAKAMDTTKTSTSTTTTTEKH